MSDRFKLPLTVNTLSAALAVEKRIALLNSPTHTTGRSPLSMARAIAYLLNSDVSMSEKVAIVRADEDPVDDRTLIGAWSLRFTGASARFDKPLLYFVRTDTREILQVAFRETTERGIFLNSAECVQSRWPKGVRPEVPLWLSDHPSCIPYDPASASEAHAIIQAAVRALYVEGNDACYYLSVHDKLFADVQPESVDMAQAFSGMYKIRSARRAGGAQVILCGAGSALHRVSLAANRLLEDWGVHCEVWSCPSYTKLARDGKRLDQWNMLHPLEDAAVCRVAACLPGLHCPVIAVTDYCRHVASQIDVHVKARFLAIGADSMSDEARPPCVEFIVFNTLHLLVQEGIVPAALLDDARQRYRETSSIVSRRT